VRRDDGRAESGHLPVRVVGVEDAALQPGVNGFDRRRLPVDFFAQCRQFFHEFGVRLRLPAGVGAGVCGAAASEVKQGFHACGKVVAGAIDRGAQHAAHAQGVIGSDDGDVVRGFDQPGNVHTHAIHAVVQVAQHGDDPGGTLSVQYAADGFARLQADLQSLVFRGQFGADLRGEFVQGLLGGGKLAATEGDHGIGLARNGVAQVAGGDAGKFERIVFVFVQGLQGAGEDFDGVAALQVDFHPGMAAFEAAHAQLVALAVKCFVLQRQGVIAIDRTGAANAQFAFFFVIEVEQDVALQPARLHGQRAFQADFFAGGKEAFERRMAEVRVGEDGENHGDADAVIRAERGAVGMYPVAFDDGADRVFAEVMHGVAVFLRDHVKVRLQDDAGFVFAPGTACLAYADIAACIAFGGQAEAGGFVKDVLLDFFFLVRRARDLRDLVEVLPDVTGGQFLDAHQRVPLVCEDDSAFIGCGLSAVAPVFCRESGV